MNVLIDMRFPDTALDDLRKIPGIDVRLVDLPEERERPLPAAMIGDIDALFCTFPPTNLADMPALSFIQIASAGYTQLVGKGLPARQIRAANALGVFDVPIAEWNIAMMVNLARHMRGMMQNQDAERWDRSALYQTEIRGATVGIWGYGGIGRETARLAKALGLRVHVLTRSPIRARNHVYCVAGTGDPEGTLPDAVFGAEQKNEFLRSLDFLIMAMPQTEATMGIVGEAEFAQMKATAFVLNPARGPLIQENALIDALKTHRIAGAALDTHYTYPMPAGHPLWQMPNVIMTPHISGSSLSPRFLDRVWDIFAHNLMRLMQGQPLLNELSASELDGK